MTNQSKIFITALFLFAFSFNSLLNSYGNPSDLNSETACEYCQEDQQEPSESKDKKEKQYEDDFIYFNFSQLKKYSTFYSFFSKQKHKAYNLAFNLKRPPRS